MTSKSSKPETDDLEATAELPQLDLDAASQASDEKEGRGDVARTDVWRVGIHSAEHSAGDAWDLADELMTVRETITGLRTELATLQSTHADLGSRHEAILAAHSQLSVTAVETAKDRERLAEERLLLLESNQQLRDQVAQQRSEFDRRAAEQDGALEQQRQATSALQNQLVKEQAEFKAAAASQQQRLDDLAALLTRESAQSQILRIELDRLQGDKDREEEAAAKLAQSSAIFVSENAMLQTAVARRDEYIQRLQQQHRDLERSLAHAEDSIDDLEDELQTARQQHTAAAALGDELQRELNAAKQRIAEMGAQLDVQTTRGQSIEHERGSLQEALNAERQSSQRLEQESQRQRERIEQLTRQLGESETTNVTLSRRIEELTSTSAEREKTLQTRQREISAAAEDNAALRQQQTSLFAEFTSAKGELENTRLTLREAQRRGEELATQIATVTRRKDELESLQQQRDQLFLDQTTELERLQHAARTAADQLDALQRDNKQQVQRNADLEAQLSEVRADFAAQAKILENLQQEMTAKEAEHTASAKQVSELQQQIRQQTEALDAIRVDIRKVAHSTERSEGELIVKTLTRIGDDGVVHLLNKAAMTIGRSADNDIQIHSDAISRHHAQLRISRDAVIVEDLGSTNGCYVNGRRMKRALLKDGDKFEVGNTAFKFGARASSSAS